MLGQLESGEEGTAEELEENVGVRSGRNAAAELAAGGRSLEVAGVVSGLLVLAVAFVVGRGVINQGVVNQQSVIGAICIYLLLGMMFMFVYGVIARLGSWTVLSSKEPTGPHRCGCTSADETVERIVRALVAVGDRYDVLVRERIEVDKAEADRLVGAPMRAVFARGVESGLLSVRLSPSLLTLAIHVA